MKFLPLLFLLLLAAVFHTVVAADEPGDIGLELNKFEQSEADCLAYLVLENRTDLAFSSFRLDIVLFDSSGLIQRRLALDVAPLESRKTRVKLFRVKSLDCGDIGRVLINEVMQCEANGKTVADCLKRIELNSRTRAQLFI